MSDSSPVVVRGLRWSRWGLGLNVENVAAGITVGLWYAAGSLPIQLDAAASLQLPTAVANSWFFVAWLTGALAGIVLTLRYRQPIAITWTIQGLVFLVSTGGRYSPAELAGASLMAGVIILVLGVVGFAEYLVRWLPLPIVMGMFAGSILGYATGIFKYLGSDPWAVGAALLGYIGARALGRRWLPPVGGAVIFGLAGALLAGEVHFEAFHWSPPMLVPVTPVLSIGGLLALSLPLVVMALGIGNVQAIGILIAEGYRPPINAVTAVLGVISVINAAFGGHPATIARNGVAVMAGSDAGPKDQRYTANIIASLIAILLALSTATAGALLNVIPLGLVASLAGLAILGTLLDSLQKALMTDLQLGAFFALAIAASPLTILGIGSAFWAVVGGILVSFVLERSALRKSVAAIG